MSTITFTGTYYHRQAWVQNNWARMASAHGAALLSSWTHGTLNVQIATINSLSNTSWPPANDNNYRVISFLAGQAGGFAYSSGSDFLGKGNYIHPLVTITSVDGTNLTNGKLYYAGSPGSFPTQNQNQPGIITRDSLEICADENISTLLGLVDGQTVTVVINLPDSIFNPDIGLKVGFDKFTGPYKDIGLKVGFDKFTGPYKDIGLKVGFSASIV